MGRRRDPNSLASIAARFHVSESALKRHVRNHLPRFLELNELTVIRSFQDEDGTAPVDMAPYYDPEAKEVAYLPLEIVLKEARRRFCVVQTEKDRSAARNHFIALLKHHVAIGQPEAVPDDFDIIAHAWPAFRVLG